VPTRKTARQKLHVDNDLPKIKPAPDIWGGGTMVIPHPTELNHLMKQVPYGKLITLDELRAHIARNHKADICCPMTAGIFVNISGAAAEEDRADGKQEITPYWRTLKRKGVLNLKFPGGLEHQIQLLQAEGHHILQKGRHFYVGHFHEYLHSFES
jgi:hypothetical protein